MSRLSEGVLLLAQESLDKAQRCHAELEARLAAAEQAVAEVHTVAESLGNAHHLHAQLAAQFAAAEKTVAEMRVLVESHEHVVALCRAAVPMCASLAAVDASMNP